MDKKPINVDQIDLEKDKDKVTEMPGLIEFPHTVGSAVVKPEDMGKVKGKAVAAMMEQTDAQMMQLFEQMQTLAKQATHIKERVAISLRIYKSKINFDPVIGKEYHLYQRKDGSDILSMIAPDEWGKKLPFEQHLAKVKLLSDHTWEVIEGNISD